MGGSKQPAVTTQINKTELPPWVDAQAQANLAEADRVAAKPYQEYEGQRVAGLTDLERQASGTLQSGIDFSNAALSGAAGAAGNAIGFTPGSISGPAGVADVNAQSFLSRNINDYMDPNLDNVVASTMTGMQQNLDRSKQQQSDAARGAGAWGGSRFGVEQAVLGAEGARQMAGAEAGLRSQAYTDAANRIQQDNALNLQGQLANQQSGLTTQGQQLTADQANLQAQLQAMGLNLQGGNLLAQLGQISSDTSGRNAILQQTLGQNERSVNQAGLDAAYENWQGKTGEDLNDLNLKMAALGMTPYGKTTTSQTTQPQQNSSNNWLTGLGSIATIGSLLFSDRSLKKEVERVGKVPGTDLNAYEFKYKKGLPGTSSKRKIIGLMADDVEKKVPGAVAKINVNGKTKKAVDYGMAISKARSDKGIPRAPYLKRVGIGTRAHA